MTNREAILEAILDDPDDDLHRLAYADCCEEEGDLAMAEFIRLSLAEADWPGRAPQGRARELLLAHWRQWVPMLSSDTSYMVVLSNRWSLQDSRGCPAVEFHRGFVERVSWSTEQFFSLAVDLFRAHPVTEVILTDVVIHPSGGNDTYYVGNLGRFPPQYWRRLENHPSQTAARDALSCVCVDHGRSLAGRVPLGGAL